MIMTISNILFDLEHTNMFDLEHTNMYMSYLLLNNFV